MASFEQIGLWQRTLGTRSSDIHGRARERLRGSLYQMREKASILVSLIPEDCRDLTVHDVSHLDALWEMADLIAGPDFQLTPAEAFVFGAAVLIHDAGTSIAAFPGGEDEIKATSEWKDSWATALHQNGITDVEVVDDDVIPPELKRDVMFDVLRLLHAKQAEKLIGAVWKNPKTGESIKLLDDQALADSYSQSIGRVAHSHHWDIEKLANELRSDVGSVPDAEFPGDWTVNEIKVACLLRCADIAHLDRRRAPTMLYALRSPGGVSGDHWSFQQHLNRPKRKIETLVYSSGKDFLVQDAGAWWLCYDVISAVDRELRQSDALLQDSGIERFAASRVLGAGNPTVLAKQIVPSGWRPVDAEIKVSDPVGLAAALGGRNLYGEGPFAPLRELLQNAVDAVRARRKIKTTTDEQWGQVRVTFERDAELENQYWLHVEDTGIGMSEAALTGPLLDFGKSFWNSSLLREDFPGLQSKGFSPIGKFGIGFFSIFLLGSRVRVISRRYLDSVDSAKILEFDGMSRRPLLRGASEQDVDDDFITRISVAIDQETMSRMAQVLQRRAALGRFDDLPLDVDSEVNPISRALAGSMRTLCAPVDVRIHVKDDVCNLAYTHEPNWHRKAPSEFLDELLSVNVRDAKHVNEIYSPLLRPLVNERGEVVGRAALAMHSDRRSRRLLREAGFISVGGFAYSDVPQSLPFVGVIAGDTSDAARKNSQVTVSPQVIAEWATEQGELLDRNKYNVFQLMEAAYKIVGLGGEPKTLPFLFLNGKAISLDNFKEKVKGASSFNIILDKDFEDTLELAVARDTSSDKFLVSQDKSNILLQSKSYFSEDDGMKSYYLNDENDIYCMSEDDVEVYKTNESFEVLYETVRDIWGGNIRCELAMEYLFSDDLLIRGGRDYVLRLRKLV